MSIERGKPTSWWDGAPEIPCAFACPDCTYVSECPLCHFSEECDA